MEDKKPISNALKTTILVGGFNVITILLSVLRVKIIAMLVGPSGMGLMSVFQNLIDIIKSITNFGINYSGAKEIASINNEKKQLYKSIAVLRFWSFVSGGIGMMFTISCSYLLSRYTFGSGKYVGEIILLSLVILFSSISGMQLAVLQGLLRIKDVLKAGLYASIISTIVIVPLYYAFGLKAIVPSMLLVSAFSLFFSWFYFREVEIVKIALPFSELFKDGFSIIKLGFFITLTGLLTNLALYLVRVILLNRDDMQSVGAFQAVWNISSLYLNTLLSSLILDFLPRLSKQFSNFGNSSKLINEQVEITLLLGAPFIVTIIAFSEMIIYAFYSTSFSMSVPLLQLQIFGAFFVIISWPLGVLFLASNKGMYSFLTELIRLTSFILIVLLGFTRFGFMILGYAYIISSVLALGAIYLATFRLIKFRYSAKNIKNIFVLFVFMCLVTMNSFYLGEGILRFFVNISLVIFCFAYCIFSLNKIMDLKFYILSKLESLRYKYINLKIKS
jgi:antigen flippase